MCCNKSFTAFTKRQPHETFMRGFSHDAENATGDVRVSPRQRGCGDVALRCNQRFTGVVCRRVFLAHASKRRRLQHAIIWGREPCVAACETRASKNVDLAAACILSQCIFKTFDLQP
jgi:hypothetical protein